MLSAPQTQTKWFLFMLVVLGPDIWIGFLLNNLSLVRSNDFVLGIGINALLSFLVGILLYLSGAISLKDAKARQDHFKIDS